MPAVEFDRDVAAAWHAEQHLETDPGIRFVYYLPTNAPDREIRLIEVNHLIGEINDDALVPLDFGVAVDGDEPYTLYVLDVTPSQWERIGAAAIPLPSGWSLESAVKFTAK